MLKMTRRQMQASAPSLEALRDAKIRRYLGEKYSLSQVDEGKFAQDIATARQFAQQQGFRSDQHIVDIVEVCFLIGAQIYRDATVQKILNNPLFGDEEKCQLLHSQVIQPRVNNSGTI